MKSFSVQHYLLLGLIAWGLPGAFIGGSTALFVTASAALPVWLLAKQPSDTSIDLLRKVGPTGSLALLILTLMYLLLDALVGRQKFDINMFLVATSTSNFIDSANAMVSQGRGVIDLLGAILVVLPFALIDTARMSQVPIRLALWGGAIIYIFYDTGISRGYLLITVLSIFLGINMKPRNLIWAGCLALAAFIAASAARGDFDEVAFANPLFDAIVWPYINLGLMIENNCGGASSLDFIAEFVKKFLPAFLVQKEIFSFNIEMTKCIYPSFLDAVGSISIFTWLGEMYYYGPGGLTSFVAGILLALLCRFVDVRLTRLQLHSLRVFSGMMCIVLLRSRIQDVFSFLLFLMIFLVILQIFTERIHGARRKRTHVLAVSEA
jgi:hypothetical protein